MSHDSPHHRYSHAPKNFTGAFTFGIALNIAFVIP